MVRIGRALEIFQVAADAGGIRARQVVVAIHVALRALHGRVRPGQREAGGRVIKGRAGPRRRVVALGTGLREAGTDVVRFVVPWKSFRWQLTQAVFALVRL